MTSPTQLDGLLVQWGERLFYPGNRIVKGAEQPRLSASMAQRAAGLRKRIDATVVRRAPQVMIKVTGGGRGMKAIAAHFRYISKGGRLEFENQDGEKLRGEEAVAALAEEWRVGGTPIDDLGWRREAFNIMLSMPRGTDPLSVLRAARDFARDELTDHKYVLVLHDHQANPHVHISVRAESSLGKRLNPRKTDLHRWRETFAEKLRNWGIDAEASRQATRGVDRNYPALWRLHAEAQGRAARSRPTRKVSSVGEVTRRDARAAWVNVAAILQSTGDPADRSSAMAIGSWVSGREPATRGLHRPVQSQQPKPSLGRGRGG